jgi:hypothetical protein
MNWLEHMIQFKDDKAKKQGANVVGVGLFTYPMHHLDWTQRNIWQRHGHRPSS